MCLKDFMFRPMKVDFYKNILKAFPQELQKNIMAIPPI